MPKPWEMFNSDPDELINQSAAKHGVDPKLVKAVGRVESRFNPKAVSKAGAQGAMQLMPATAKSLGVKDPFDMAQNIEGGTKLLGQLNKKYQGDRAKVLAAYNAGEGAVDRVGGIPDIPETKDYVQKVNAEYGGGKPWEMFADKFGDPEELKAKHEANLAAGRAQDISGGLNVAAQAVRGATPAAAALAGLTSFGGLAPVVFGGGELLAEQLEKSAGAREQLNPYTVAGEAALGALPMPDIAMKLAAKTPFPRVAYPFFKAPEGAAQGMGYTLASHGIGAATSGLPGAEGSESPPLTGQELINAGVAGGGMATLGSFARIHSIAREAGDLNYKTGGNRLFRGISMPLRGQKAEFMGKTFDGWLPIIHDYAKAENIKVDTLKDLRGATERLSNDYYQHTYLPLIEPIRNQQVSTQSIYDALEGHLLNNRKLMVENPGLKDTLMKKVEVYKGATTSVDDLLKLRESYNAATKPLMKRTNVAQDINMSTTNEAEMVINKAIRETLNDAVEKAYAGQPNAPDVREILRNQRDIMTMSDHITEASQSWDAQQRAESGERVKIVSSLARPIARSSARGGAHGLIGSAATGAYNILNNPDSLVRSGFKLLSRVTPSYQIPIKGKGPTSNTALQPQQLQGPPEPPDSMQQAP